MSWTRIEGSTLAGSSSPISGDEGAVLASASTVTLTDAYHRISGTTQINNFSFAGGTDRGIFLVRPTGAFPIGSGGNIIGAPSVATADRILQFWYDGTDYYYMTSNPDISSITGIDVASYATAGAGTSGDPWTGWESAISASGNYLFRRGTFAFATTLDYGALDGSRFIGSGNGTILKHTGTGKAFTIVGASGDCYNIEMYNITIQGNASTTNGLYLQGCHHSRFVRIRIRDVSAEAILLKGCVGNVFDLPSVSVNEPGGFAVTPTEGITFDAQAGSPTTTTTINGGIFEGVSGSGIHLKGCHDIAFIGGVSESNNRGLEIDAFSGSTPANNLFCMDFEANTTEDVLCKSPKNTFIKCLSTTTFHISTGTGNDNIILGGSLWNLTIDSGCLRNVVAARVENTYTNNGTDTVRLTENLSAATLQTSGNVGIGGAPSGVATELITAQSSADAAALIIAKNTGNGVSARGRLTAINDLGAGAQVSMNGSGNTATRAGVTVANYAELNSNTIASGLLIGTTSAQPVKLYTNNSNVAASFDGTNGHKSFPVSHKIVTTQFDKTSDTTLANVTGLSVALTAAKKYRFIANLSTTSNVAGGVKFAVGGTATATAVRYGASVTEVGYVTVGTARAAALGTAVGDVTAVTVADCVISGYIEVNVAGTLTIQFAQNASNGAASSVLVGSDLTVEEIA